MCVLIVKGMFLKPTWIALLDESRLLAGRTGKIGNLKKKKKPLSVLGSIVVGPLLCLIPSS